MRKKLEELAAKTGAEKKDTAALWKLGFAGFFVCAAAFIAGCASRGHKNDVPPQQNPQASQAAPQDKNGEKLPDIKPSANGGPWENYPAGTRYFTVSIHDFKQA